MAYFSSNDGFQVLAEPYPPDGSFNRLSEPGVASAWPVWSKTDSSVRFLVGPLNNYGAVDVDTQNFAIRNRRSLPIRAETTGGRWHDSMPGSDEIVVVTSVEGVETRDENVRLVVVENMLEELKQRGPAN